MKAGLGVTDCVIQNLSVGQGEHSSKNARNEEGGDADSADSQATIDMHVQPGSGEVNDKGGEVADNQSRWVLLTWFDIADSVVDVPVDVGRALDIMRGDGTAGLEAGDGNAELSSEVHDRVNGNDENLLSPQAAVDETAKNGDEYEHVDGEKRLRTTVKEKRKRKKKPLKIAMRNTSAKMTMKVLMEAPARRLSVGWRGR